MDVSVETTGNLGRRLKVTVPAAEIEKRVSVRLRKMMRTVRLDGFRPGRVPEKLIRERYGEQVFREVTAEVMESSYQKAIEEHQLVPAGPPDFKETDVLSGQDFRFTVDVELYPEFEPAPLSGAKVIREVAEVRDSDVADVVERLRLSHADWRPVQRPVRDGDRVRVHFEKPVEAFNLDDNGDLVLVVGTGTGVSGDFGAQLLEADHGAVKKIKTRFPGDFPDAGLAGKRLKFKVEVREIEESILPALDRDFFDKCGVREGGLEALKKALREGMEYELKHRIENNFRNRVLDVLLEKHDFEAPRVLVRREIERMRDGVAERLEIKEDDGKLRDEMFSEQADRRVRIGLIMSKIAERNRFDVSEQEFEDRLDGVVAGSEDPDAARRYYRNDRQARSSLVGMVLEDKAFRWVVDQVDVVEKPCNFKDLSRR